MKEIQMALTPNFVWLATGDIEGDYLEFKQLKPEKVITADESDLEYFNCTVFKGYHWNTLAFQTKGIYDLYRVFDRWELILETADVIVELPEWYTPTDDTKIEAYERLEWDRLLLLWVGYRNGDIIERKKSDSYKLSVVVPLYNSELFMCRTIDAILSSTLTDIELILINDWSTDKSWEIAKRYANNYPCVTAIDQENKWVAITRNYWLELCKWEYMAFCDNDDIPHPYMYEKLYQTSKDQWTDVAIAQTLIRKRPNEKERYLECSDRKEDIVVYDFDEMFKHRNTKGNIFFVAVWNKIVKTEVARLAKFPTDYTWPWVLYEDVAYTGSLYSYIDKFAYNREAIYMWDKRKQHTVWTASTRHKECDNEYVWKMFIYGFSYMLYNKSWKHLERHDYSHFKRLIESYKKFTTPSPLLDYRNLKLHELINSQKLYDNKLIMWDSELKALVDRLR